MLEVILETILSTLAETFVGKAIEKSQKKNARAWGVINLIILVVLIIGLIWLGIYLLFNDAVWVAILVFLIAAFILFIMILSTVRGVRKRLGKK